MTTQAVATEAPSTWEVVKALQVSLRPTVALSVQSFRSRQWYVLSDKESGETFRVSDSLKFIFEKASADLNIGAALALDTPHADSELKEQIALALVQLYRSHLIDLSPDEHVPAQLKQLRAQQTSKKKRFNPLSIRIPLFDPDELFRKLKPLTDKLFHPLALFVMIAVAAGGLLVGLAHLSDISNDALSQLETPNRWWIFVAAYIVLKIIHEAAHGFAVKRWNGHVHDVGVMLLVLFPVPYVDASASSAFEDKYQRIGVASAGIIAEALCAGLAVFAWLAMEPGLLRTFAFDVILIGGVSTLLFNGNPLMRFDAYYVLADYLEIPNLFTRSRKYLDYFLIRYMLGDRDRSMVTHSNAEAGWLLSYAIGSSIYRLVIMLSITTYLVNTFFFIGVALAIYVAIAQLMVPVWRFSLQLRRSDKNSQRNFGLVTRFACIVISVAGLLVFVPVPQTTVAHGVVTVDDNAHIRAEVGGFVTESTINAVQTVRAGDVVARLSNAELARDYAVMQAAIKGIQSEMNAARRDGVEVGIMKESLRARKRELAEIETRVASLAIISSKSGTLVAASATPIADMYVEKGETVGYVVAPEHLIVRFVLTEADLALVQSDVRAVELMVMSEHGEAYEAELVRVVPSALRELPSKALGTEADGSIAVDPTDENGLKPIENVFQVDIKTTEPMVGVNVATRAYARFVHADEPLWPRAVRAVRRLFLSRFSV